MSPSAVGLQFTTSRRDHGASLALRMRLSGDAVLQLRPRRHGLQVTYRSQF